VGNVSISQLGFRMGPSTRSLRARLLADPAMDEPAHRVGDWVFTYPGILPIETDLNLWLAIGWPDPVLNPSDPTVVLIVRPQGLYDELTVAEFDVLLTKQNELRATHQLPALVHPRTVKATTMPATAVVQPRPPVDASEPVVDDPPVPVP